MRIDERVRRPESTKRFCFAFTEGPTWPGPSAQTRRAQTMAFILGTYHCAHEGASVAPRSVCVILSIFVSVTKYKKHRFVLLSIQSLSCLKALCQSRTLRFKPCLAETKQKMYGRKHFCLASSYNPETVRPRSASDLQIGLRLYRTYTFSSCVRLEVLTVL